MPVVNVPLGENIKGSLDGDKLTLVIDLKQTLRNAKSGKNVLVATTGGNMGIPGTSVKIGLNAYKPL